MQPVFDPRDGEDFESPAPMQHRQIDSAALRIIATWITERDRLDPELGAPIDRGFVVAQAHA